MQICVVHLKCKCATTALKPSHFGGGRSRSVRIGGSGHVCRDKGILLGSDEIGSGGMAEAFVA